MNGEPQCPICCRPFSECCTATSGAWMCNSCGHLWQVVDGRAVALNSTGHPVSEHAAKTIAVGPMTAKRAHPFVKKEIG